jgi:PAS domain S-box-containing protein
MSSWDLSGAAASGARRWAEVTLASIGDAVLCTDGAGRITFVNYVAELLTGWPSQEALGRPVGDVFRIINEHTRAVVENPVAKVLASGVIAGLANHTLLIARDGREIPIDDSGAPITSEDGSVSGVVLVFRDMTERREAERRLRESEERYRAIVETANEGVWQIDTLGRTQYVNGRLCAMLGYTAGEMTGRAVAEFCFPEDVSVAAERIGANLAGAPEQFDFRFRRKDGAEVLVLASTSPVYDNRGAIAGALGMFADVTGRRRAERALHASEQRLARILESIGDAFYAFDTRWTCAYVNDRATEQTGKARRDLLGRTLWELFPAALGSSFETAIREAVPGQLPPPFETYYDATSRWLELRAYPASDGFTLLVHDVTGRKAAAQALERAQRQVADILGSITESFIAVDRQWRFTYVNDRVLRVIGKKKNEVIGKVLWDVFPEAANTEFYPQYHRVMEERTPANFEVHYPSGVWLDVHANPTEEGLSAYVVDITQRKRAEEARALLASIVASSDDAIIGKDLNGVITSWNAAAERIFGYTAEEAIGRPVSLLAPPERTGEMQPILERIKRGERLSHFETVRRSKDGRDILVSLTVSPIRDVNGELIGASKTARDVTDQKRMEERLREAAKLESLGILAGGIAHDFNNLLVGILGNASLVAEELPAGSLHRELLEGVLEASERAAQLIRQMLAYAGKGQFLLETVDLSHQVRQIAALLQAGISKGIVLRFQLSPDPLPIEVDVGQLQQIVMNLILNAAEALEPGTGVVTVATRMEDVAQQDLGSLIASEDMKPGRYVVFEVSDTGCGMDEDTRSRIFDPFFSTKFTGRGLGLAAVRGIVRGHKGGLRVRSSPGQGSTFTVYLQQADVYMPRPAVERALAPRGHGTVLIIDDEEVVRRTAASGLERQGYSVVTAANGAEGLRVFEQRPGDVSLVLLDMTMPVMGGHETLQRIRRLRPDVKVLASSGYDEREAAREFGDGLAGFIQKPYTARDLSAKVAAILSGPNAALSMAGK